jgi:hypothetical protein
MSLLFPPRLLDLMQDFVTLIDAGPSFLLAREAECIVEVADDASILEMQLGREMKLNRHPADNPRASLLVPTRDAAAAA